MVRLEETSDQLVVGTHFSLTWDPPYTSEVTDLQREDQPLTMCYSLHKDPSPPLVASPEQRRMQQRAAECAGQRGGGGEAGATAAASDPKASGNGKAQRARVHSDA